jgi:hypothetical protein
LAAAAAVDYITLAAKVGHQLLQILQQQLVAAAAEAALLEVVEALAVVVVVLEEVPPLAGERVLLDKEIVVAVAAIRIRLQLL